MIVPEKRKIWNNCQRSKEMYLKNVFIYWKTDIENCTMSWNQWIMSICTYEFPKSNTTIIILSMALSITTPIITVTSL